MAACTNVIKRRLDTFTENKGLSPWGLYAVPRVWSSLPLNMGAGKISMPHSWAMPHAWLATVGNRMLDFVVNQQGPFPSSVTKGNKLLLCSCSLSHTRMRARTHRAWQQAYGYPRLLHGDEKLCCWYSTGILAQLWHRNVTRSRRCTWSMLLLIMCEGPQLLDRPTSESKCSC